MQIPSIKTNLIRSLRGNGQTPRRVQGFELLDLWIPSPAPLKVLEGWPPISTIHICWSYFRTVEPKLVQAIKSLNRSLHIGIGRLRNDKAQVTASSPMKCENPFNVTSLFGNARIIGKSVFKASSHRGSEALGFIVITTESHCQPRQPLFGYRIISRCCLVSFDQVVGKLG